MKHKHHILTAFKKEFTDWRRWWARGVVIALAAVAGLVVVGFTWLSERALALFFDLPTTWWWAPFARRWFPKPTPVTAHGLLVAASCWPGSLRCRSTAIPPISV